MALAFLTACSGCTTLSLEHYTLRQIESGGEYSTDETLACLATVAADPDTLPSFALLADGVTKITDQATASSLAETGRQVYTFPYANAGFLASRSPQVQWTLDPVVDFERLQAMRCACRWAISGPGSLCPECVDILKSPEEYDPDRPEQDAGEGPEQDYTEKTRFGVADRLEKLPAGWLHVGRLKDVPLCACRKAHRGGVWVWVTPEGMRPLAEFTLVLNDIATLAASAIHPKPLLVTLTRQEFTNIRDPADPDKKVQVIRSDEIRVIRPRYKATVEKRIEEGVASGHVDISWAEWMQYTTPYRGARSNLNPAVAVGTPSPQEAVPSRPVSPAPGLPAPVTPPKKPGEQKQGARNP